MISNSIRWHWQLEYVYSYMNLNLFWGQRSFEKLKIYSSAEQQQQPHRQHPKQQCDSGQRYLISISEKFQWLFPSNRITCEPNRNVDIFCVAIIINITPQFIGTLSPAFFRCSNKKRAVSREEKNRKHK